MTVYFLYDEEFYFAGTREADVQPENSTTVEPEFQEGYWLKFDETAWTAEKIPTTAAEIIGLSVPVGPSDPMEEDPTPQHQKLLRSIIFNILATTTDAKAVTKDGIITVVAVTYEDKLEAAKEKKLAELNELSHQFDDQLVCESMVIKSSLGFDANADIRSQNNIAGLLSAGADPVQYCDANNVFHTLSLAQLEVLKSECVQNGQYLYQQKWSYRLAINKATSIEAVEAITIEFTMMDFSKAE